MKPMKYRLTHNLGLKLISVLIATVLWLVVSNHNDPEVTRVLKNVPITFKNQEMITKINKTYTVVDGIEKVNVYVVERKSITNRLRSNMFTVKADLQNYNEALGTVPLEISCSDSHIGEEDIRIIPSTIKLAMEDKIEESFGIATTVTGKMEKGYELGKATIVAGDTVKIAGPSSLIRIIGKVTVAVDVSEEREDREELFPIRIEDKNGDLLTENQMSKLEIKNEDGVIFAENKAKVAIKVWKMYKDIPVKLELVGTPEENYRVSKITVTPRSVNLVGDQRSIEKLDGVLKLAESISVEGMNQTQEYTLDLNDTLNLYDNIRLEADTTSTIKVTIDIAVSGSKSVSVPISNLKMLNIPEEKKLIFSPADYITVNVKTTEMDLDELSPQDIKAMIDLKNCTVNDSYTVPVEITLPEGYEQIGEVSLVVNIDDLDNEAEREASAEGESTW